MELSDGEAAALECSACLLYVDRRGIYIVAYRKGERVIRNLNKKTHLDHLGKGREADFRPSTSSRFGGGLMDIFYTQYKH